jgi:cyclic beta-1,2-glucan synthetase
MEVRGDPETWRGAVEALSERECPELDRALSRLLQPLGATGAETLREVRTWLERLHHHLQSMQREMEVLLPWLALTSNPPPGCEEIANGVVDLLPPTVPLSDVAELCARAREMLAAADVVPNGGEAAVQWRTDLDAALEAGARSARDLREAVGDAAARAEAQAWAMDFGLLYDRDSRLFFIGYNISVDRLDPHHYDLLATEARLASFFAIVKGDVPLEHWFFLGRPLAEAHGRVMLVSWGGSMFEYLMPPLLLRSHRETLLGQSERMAVEAQRRYARKLGVPWGMSESGFASLSPDRHYRYRAFGVPGLGLRRGLSLDQVVAPYAAVLALAVLPETAAANLHELEELGMVGRYGLFEAVDFTPERVPEGRRFWAVRSYMAHHQGMILAALGNALIGNALVRRFHANPRVRAVALLLDERVPRELPPQVVLVDVHRPHRRPGCLCRREPPRSSMRWGTVGLPPGSPKRAAAACIGTSMRSRAGCRTRSGTSTGSGSTSATKRVAPYGPWVGSRPASSRRRPKSSSMRTWPSFIGATRASRSGWTWECFPATTSRFAGSPW